MTRLSANNWDRSGSLERLATDFAVAWAELIGLQRIENAQRVLGSAANVEVGCVNMLDRIVRVDNKGVAVCHTIRRANAKTINQRTIRVGKRPDRQLVEILVITTPCELHEFIVGRATKNDGVTVFEVRCKTRKFCDFGRANKGEVLRVEEDDLPLAREACFGDFFKCRNTIFFMMVEAGLYAGDLEGGSLSPIPSILYLPVNSVSMRKFLNFQNFPSTSHI